MGECWEGWEVGSWLDGSWCPTTPAPPVVVTMIGGGYSPRYAYPPRKKLDELDEEAIALMLLLLDDD